MFKHILIPTDGSPASARAVRAGLAFARKNGARVTGYHCIDPVREIYAGEGYIPDRRITAELERRSRLASTQLIARMGRAARKAKVPFRPLVETATAPYRAIAEAAARRKCDLIFIGTQGRTGFARLAIGSVAERVVRASKVPVLVYR
jgi:nucleotide-binding universal stress UspA family protein